MGSGRKRSALSAEQGACCGPRSGGLGIMTRAEGMRSTGCVAGAPLRIQLRVENIETYMVVYVEGQSRGKLFPRTVPGRGRG